MRRTGLKQDVATSKGGKLKQTKTSRLMDPEGNQGNYIPLYF